MAPLQDVYGCGTDYYIQLGWQKLKEVAVERGGLNHLLFILARIPFFNQSYDVLREWQMLNQLRNESMSVSSNIIVQKPSIPFSLAWDKHRNLSQDSSKGSKPLCLLSLFLTVTDTMKIRGIFSLKSRLKNGKQTLQKLFQHILTQLLCLKLHCSNSSAKENDDRKCPPFSCSSCPIGHKKSLHKNIIMSSRLLMIHHFDFGLLQCLLLLYVSITPLF